ncbi:TrpR-binding protein WrbA [Streptomyces longispororuber]|uniref:TrpR-binding protein WrbA n=1 Tax=Streptomyces longispororuber TaxID=68230 RepID=A0A918ZG77_9ACTN|nr:NAD(P)H:quinone oxidoreductase [Streptomyces longispororuber]GHE49737.1 TrpR-binding protein WrbA [Streptomyces longispororuber]
MTNAAVIYYSSTGQVHELAVAAATAAEKAGAEVRLRRVAELAPAEAIAANPGWTAHHEATKNIEPASLDDLTWADVILFGSPTRFGLPAAQLKQFIDTTGGLWAQGALVDKVVSSFTSTSSTHGGQESTVLALNNTFYHWGAIIVPPGYADEVQFAPSNGNPYGASSVSAHGEARPTEDNLASMRFQATRCVEVAAALRRGRHTD